MSTCTWAEAHGIWTIRARKSAPYHCMSLRSIRLACLLGAVLSIALPRAAWSAPCRTGWCDCDDPYRRHGSVRQGVKVLRDSARAIVIGTIVRIGPELDGVGADTTAQSPPAIAWVQVTHRWKGPSRDTLRVRLHPPGEAEASCQYAVAPGERHLFFLRQDGTGRFHAGRCSGSLRLDAPPGETSAAARATADSVIAALGPGVQFAALGHDSTLADTIAPLYSGPVHDPKMYALVYAAWIPLMVAPAAFVLLPMTDSGRTAVLENYVSAHVAVGYAEHERRGWAHVHAVETLWNGLFAEVRAQAYRVPEYSGVQAARAGYLWRRRRHLAGGVTAGYVRGSGEYLPGGLEIGLPLLLRTQRGSIRYEAAYIITPEFGYWNWRMVGEFPFPQKPFAGGFNLDARTPLRDEELFYGLTLFVGVRF